jgi:hypothetical protein
MTLVGRTARRNRNELVSIFIPAVPYETKWGLLRHVSAFDKDAVVAPVIRNTGLTATAREFRGIVTVWLGKTAREGGRRMTLMGHAEEQCRHVTWGASDQRRR